MTAACVVEVTPHDAAKEGGMMSGREHTALLARQMYAVYRTSGWRGVRAWINNAPSEADAWNRIGLTGALTGYECPACDGHGATPESARLMFEAPTIDAALALEPQRCRLCCGVGRRER